MGGSSMNLWQELLPGDNGKPINDLLKKQYDVVYGSWPNSYDEIVLVLDENNELDDMTLYALGLEPKEDVDNIMEAAVNGKELKTTTRAGPMKISAIWISAPFSIPTATAMTKVPACTPISGIRMPACSTSTTMG